MNLSESDFAVVFAPDEPRTNTTGHIRFGLSAVKNLPQGAIREILAERKARGAFTSLFDFCERIDPAKVTPKTVELLVKAGCFDALHSIDDRAAMVATIPDCMAASRRAAEARRSGQDSLFGGGGGEAAIELPEVPLRKADPWSRAESLAFEKERSASTSPGTRSTSGGRGSSSSATQERATSRRCPRAPRCF